MLQLPGRWKLMTGAEIKAERRASHREGFEMAALVHHANHWRATISDPSAREIVKHISQYLAGSGEDFCSAKAESDLFGFGIKKTKVYLSDCWVTAESQEVGRAGLVSILRWLNRNVINRNVDAI